MTHDRAHTDIFFITHLFLASMLGVRRKGVTKTAGVLQQRLLIRYSPGCLTVAERRGLWSLPPASATATAARLGNDGWADPSGRRQAASFLWSRIRMHPVAQTHDARRTTVVSPLPADGKILA